jgi:hypothetical protein
MDCNGPALVRQGSSAELIDGIITASTPVNPIGAKRMLEYSSFFDDAQTFLLFSNGHEIPA